MQIADNRYLKMKKAQKVLSPLNQVMEVKLERSSSSSSSVPMGLMFVHLCASGGTNYRGQYPLTSYLFVFTSAV
jgi:hypothetical protein